MHTVLTHYFFLCFPWHLIRYSLYNYLWRTYYGQRAQETPKNIKNRNISCPHAAYSFLLLYPLSTKPIPLFWSNFDLLATKIIMSGIKNSYSIFFSCSRIDAGHHFAIFSQIGIFHIHPWSFFFFFGCIWVCWSLLIFGLNIHWIRHKCCICCFLFWEIRKRCVGTWSTLFCYI